MALADRKVPVFPGWITLSEAADRIGVTRQTINRWASDGTLKSVHSLGNIYIVEMKEVSVLRRKKSAKLMGAG